MKKIGLTLSGSLIVEMSEDEFRRISLLPVRDEALALDVIKAATEKGRLTLYNFKALLPLFSTNGEFAGLSAIQMLERIEQSKPKYRLQDYPRLSPTIVRKLWGIFADRKVT